MTHPLIRELHKRFYGRAIYIDIYIYRPPSEWRVVFSHLNASMVAWYKIVANDDVEISTFISDKSLALEVVEYAQQIEILFI